MPQRDWGKMSVQEKNRVHHDYRKRLRRLLAKISKSGRAKRHGYIYLIWSPTLNMYKLGKSKNPHRRIAGLRTGIPGGLEVQHIIETDDMTIAEEWWHLQYVNEHVDGEWFTMEHGEEKYFFKFGNFLSLKRIKRELEDFIEFQDVYLPR